MVNVGNAKLHFYSRFIRFKDVYHWIKETWMSYKSDIEIARSAEKNQFKKLVLTLEFLQNICYRMAMIKPK